MSVDRALELTIASRILVQMRRSASCAEPFPFALFPSAPILTVFSRSMYKDDYDREHAHDRRMDERLSSLDFQLGVLRLWGLAPS